MEESQLTIISYDSKSRNTRSLRISLKNLASHRFAASGCWSQFSYNDSASKFVHGSLFPQNNMHGFDTGDVWSYPAVGCKRKVKRSTGQCLSQHKYNHSYFRFVPCFPDDICTRLCNSSRRALFADLCRSFALLQIMHVDISTTTWIPPGDDHVILPQSSKSCVRASRGVAKQESAHI